MWFLLLLSLSAFSDDMASEKYCFPSVEAADSARQNFSMIQLKNDIVKQAGQCLVIQMPPHRRELIQRYILQSTPGASVVFSSAEVKREPCRLTVEKEKQINQETKSGGINRGFSVSSSTAQGTQKEVMEIVTQEEFQLTVDQDEIKGKCRYINPNRVDITLEVRKNPKPLVPANLPPGTIVVVNQPQPDQETSLLSTQLQLSRGERINIGNVVKDLRDKNTSLDANPEVKVETTRGKVTESVYLLIK